MQWGCNSTKVSYKTSVEISKSQELLQFLTGNGSGPFGYRANLSGIHLDVILRDDEP